MKDGHTSTQSEDKAFRPSTPEGIEAPARHIHIVSEEVKPPAPEAGDDSQPSEDSKPERPEGGEDSQEPEQPSAQPAEEPNSPEENEEKNQ